MSWHLLTRYLDMQQLDDSERKEMIGQYREMIDHAVKQKDKVQLKSFIDLAQAKGFDGLKKYATQQMALIEKTATLKERALNTKNLVKNMAANKDVQKSDIEQLKTQFAQLKKEIVDVELELVKNDEFVEHKTQLDENTAHISQQYEWISKLESAVTYDDYKYIKVQLETVETDIKLKKNDMPRFAKLDLLISRCQQFIQNTDLLEAELLHLKNGLQKKNKNRIVKSIDKLEKMPDHCLKRKDVQTLLKEGKTMCTYLQNVEKAVKSLIELLKQDNLQSAQLGYFLNTNTVYIPQDLNKRATEILNSLLSKKKINLKERVDEMEKMFIVGDFSQEEEEEVVVPALSITNTTPNANDMVSKASPQSDKDALEALLDEDDSPRKLETEPVKQVSPVIKPSETGYDEQSDDDFMNSLEKKQTPPKEAPIQKVESGRRQTKIILNKNVVKKPDVVVQEQNPTTPKSAPVVINKAKIIKKPEQQVNKPAEKPVDAEPEKPIEKIVEPVHVPEQLPEPVKPTSVDVVVPQPIAPVAEPVKDIDGAVNQNIEPTPEQQQPNKADEEEAKAMFNELNKKNADEDDEYEDAEIVVSSFEKAQQVIANSQSMKQKKPDSLAYLEKLKEGEIPLHLQRKCNSSHPLIDMWHKMQSQVMHITALDQLHVVTRKTQFGNNLIGAMESVMSNRLRPKLFWQPRSVFEVFKQFKIHDVQIAVKYFEEKQCMIAFLTNNYCSCKIRAIHFRIASIYTILAGKR